MPASIEEFNKAKCMYVEARRSDDRDPTRSDVTRRDQPCPSVSVYGPTRRDRPETSRDRAAGLHLGGRAGNQQETNNTRNCQRSNKYQASKLSTKPIECLASNRIACQQGEYYVSERSTSTQRF